MNSQIEKARELLRQLEGKNDDSGEHKRAILLQMALFSRNKKGIKE
jgi:hypothetical protein